MIFAALFDWRKGRKVRRLKDELVTARDHYQGVGLAGAPWEIRQAALNEVRLLEAEIIYLGGAL